MGYGYTKFFASIGVGCAASAYLTEVYGSTTSAPMTALATIFAARLLMEMGEHFGKRTAHREATERAIAIADQRIREHTARHAPQPTIPANAHTTITLCGPAGEREVRDNPTKFIGTIVIFNTPGARRPTVWLWNGAAGRYADNTLGAQDIGDGSYALWFTRADVVGRFHFLVRPGAETVVQRMNELRGEPQRAARLEAQARGWIDDDFEQVVAILGYPRFLLGDDDFDDGTTDLDTHLLRLHEEANRAAAEPATPLRPGPRALDLDD